MSDKAKRAADLLSLLENLKVIEATSNSSKHEFWSTQPVPQTRAEVLEIDKDGPIDLDAPNKIRHEPLPLPTGLKFSRFKIDEEQDLQELYELLCENYVEDYESLFRFEYSQAFLKWALKAPGWNKNWHVAIRSEASGKLVAFISAIPCKFRIRKSLLESVEVNFLCVEKSLRSRRLAPILIKEVTRRVNLEGIFQALYTAGIPLPEPIGTAQYYHRPLNFKKLLETNFTFLPPGKSVEQMEKYYKLQTEKPCLPIRKLCKNNLPRVKELLDNYLDKFKLSHVMSLEEMEHWFLPREDVVYSYAVLNQDDVNDGDDENIENINIVDFFSFYSIPSSILSEASHQRINVAYLFYYSVSEEIRLLPLIKTALQEAARLGFDVLNCLNLMDNQEDVLNALKFGAGDGQLRFYLYNWKTRLLNPREIGFIML